MSAHLDASFYEPIEVVLPRADVAVSFATSQARATAFVAAGEPSDGLRCVYYHEPRAGTPSTFADRVIHAHGRAWSDRPRDRGPRERKRLVVRALEIQRIGTYDPREGEVLLDPDPAIREQLISWLDLEHADDPDTALTTELLTTISAAHDVRRRLRQLIAAGHRHDPALRQYARRRGHGDLFGDPPPTH